MTGEVIQVGTVEIDALAGEIVDYWRTWDDQRAGWKAEADELNAYLFATDTSTTSNKDLPWNNSTTVPKLTQIRDNLHSNYLSALFPNDDWLTWEAYTPDDATRAKALAIEGYMQNKIRNSNFRDVISQLLLDYIDYGNAFATVDYVTKVAEVDGERQILYAGPIAKRISPYDIAFNPVVEDFNNTPLIRRSLMQLGDMVRWTEDSTESIDKDALGRMLKMRGSTKGGSLGREDMERLGQYYRDGFGSYNENVKKGVIEVLTFYGDIYDYNTGELKRNREIVIADRMFVLKDEPIKSWTGRNTHHVGWRKRPDNLWAMGPLNNLVGMQYRVDHLENLKADVFDLVARPVIVRYGEVENFTWAPGEEINIPSMNEGRVELLNVSSSAMNADMQIQTTMHTMEEMAGAPREAMGIRSAGEKTAFEVNQLMTAAGRIFQEKITTFEIEILEPLLNSMLEVARRNLDQVDLSRTMDDETGSIMFTQVTKDDIKGSGILRPVGARHFGEQAKMLQELVQLFNTGLGQQLSQHTKLTEVTKLVEDTLGVGRFKLFQKHAGLVEQAESQALNQELAQENLATAQQEGL